VTDADVRTHGRVTAHSALSIYAICCHTPKKLLVLLWKATASWAFCSANCTPSLEQFTRQHLHFQQFCHHLFLSAYDILLPHSATKLSSSMWITVLLTKPWTKRLLVLIQTFIPRCIIRRECMWSRALQIWIKYFQTVFSGIRRSCFLKCYHTQPKLYTFQMWFHNPQRFQTLVNTVFTLLHYMGQHVSPIKITSVLDFFRFTG